MTLSLKLGTTNWSLKNRQKIASMNLCPWSDDQNPACFCVTHFIPFLRKLWHLKTCKNIKKSNFLLFSPFGRFLFTPQFSVRVFQTDVRTDNSLLQRRSAASKNISQKATELRDRFGSGIFLVKKMPNIDKSMYKKYRQKFVSKYQNPRSDGPNSRCFLRARFIPFLP